MKILHLTDIHSKRSLIEKLANDLKEVDLVLISGDITHFGRTSETEEIISEIQKYNKSIYAVSGNCDYPEVKQFLEEHSISLDKNKIAVGDFSIMGMGGSLPCPGTTPNEFSEEVFELELLNLYKSFNGMPNNLILMVHQPPKKTKNDRIKFGLHVGSSAVKKFIEDKQPLLVLSGHIHEGRGVDEIGKTRIVNPGPFKEGNYAIIEIQNSEISVTLKKV